MFPSQPSLVIFSPGPWTDSCAVKTLEEARLGLHFSDEDISVPPFLCIDRDWSVATPVAPASFPCHATRQAPNHLVQPVKLAPLKLILIL